MNLVQPRMTVADDFHKHTSTTPLYNIGCEIAVAEDSAAQPTVYKYIKASAALTANAPVVLVQKAGEIGTAAPATSTVAKIVGIPQVAIASGSYGFVAIQGPCIASTGVQAKGDTLEVLNGGTSLVVDGSSGTPAESAGTVAISAEAASSEGKVKVILLGKAVTVAAS